MPKPDFDLEFIHRTFKHDRFRARAYLQHFVERVETGKKPDKRVAQWMAQALREYLDDGKPLEKAFAVTKTRGRDRTWAQAEREVQAAIAVASLMETGVRKEDAVERIAKKRHMSVSIVTKHYDKQRSIAVWFLNQKRQGKALLNSVRAGLTDSTPKK